MITFKTKILLPNYYIIKKNKQKLTMDVRTKYKSKKIYLQYSKTSISKTNFILHSYCSYSENSQKPQTAIFNLFMKKD